MPDVLRLLTRAVPLAAAVLVFPASAVAVGTATLSTTSFAFPQTPLWEVSDAQTVTIANSGTSALLLSNVSLVGPDASDFVAETGCPSTVASGQSCTIEVVYTPSAVGPASATLSFDTSDPGRSHPSIQLSGTGSRDTVMNDVVADDDEDVAADDLSDDETADDASDDETADDETADDEASEEASDDAPAKKTAAVAVSATCGLRSKGKSVSCAVRVTAKSGTATAAGAVTLSSAGRVVARGSVQGGRARLRATKRALGHKRYVLTVRYRQAGKARVVRRVVAL